MSVKLATSGVLKKNLILNKGYDHGVISKILSHVSNYFVDVVMGLKSGTSSISIKRSYHNLNF